MCLTQSDKKLMFLKKKLFDIMIDSDLLQSIFQ